MVCKGVGVACRPIDYHPIKRQNTRFFQSWVLARWRLKYPSFIPATIRGNHESSCNSQACC